MTGERIPDDLMQVDDIGYARVRIDTPPNKYGWCFCTPTRHPEDIERGLEPFDDSSQIHAQVVPRPPFRWYAMDAAPKDGSRFLAVVDGMVRVVAWCKTSHVPIWGFNLVDQGAEDCEICEPTLWMPLPTP